MGFERYLLHGFFTARELDKLDQRLAHLRRLDHERRLTALARIETLETDLGRIALVTRALADLCIAKGVLTKDELLRQLPEADLADGVRDERLTADTVLPGESKPAPPPAPVARKKPTSRKRPNP